MGKSQTADLATDTVNLQDSLELPAEIVFYVYGYAYPEQYH